MKFSLIHPSRGRPKQAFETALQWLTKAGNVELEWILSIDSDDSLKKDYLTLSDGLVNQLLCYDNKSVVEATNRAAKVATGDVLVYLSDDFECPENWGEQIVQAAQGKTDWIMKTPDGIQKWIISMPIMDRAYYNRFGYIYYPEYLHMFCDTELTCVADLTGRKIEADIPFKHNHYSVGGVKDSISERADKTWNQGEQLFIKRYKENFGLVNPPGKITSVEYLNWIRGKLR